MQKWEYKTVLISRTCDPRTRLKFLSDLGQVGWELVTIDNEIFYFKRPIPEEMKPV